MSPPPPPPPPPPPLPSPSVRASNSSPSATVFHPPAPTRGARTMEEVWKNIDHHHPSEVHGSIILQDFLASSGPSLDRKIPSQPQPPLPTSAAPLFPPATILSLNSGGLGHFISPSSAATTATLSSPTAPFSGTGHFFSFSGKKRLPENHHHHHQKQQAPKHQQQMERSIEDRDGRYKRMIKNRESAARSRARKQAYTNELELEASSLAEENARLKKQYEELQLVLAAQLPIKKKLFRTATAPF